MTAALWMDKFCACPRVPDELTNTRAKNLIALVNQDGYGGIEVVRTCGNADGLEAIVLNIEIPLGQKETVYDVRSIEPIAIIFGPGDLLPCVIPLRDDFPDVPHLNSAPKGAPRSLCLYEEPWPEIKLCWTPLQILEMIRRWFEQTAYGELHADDQPLDPLFLGGSLFTLIVPPSTLSEDFHGEFFVSNVINEDQTEILFLKDARQQMEVDHDATAAAVLITTQPQPNGRLLYAPNSLQELVDCDENIGCQIVAKLRVKIRYWVEKQSDLLDKKLMVVVNIPIQRETGAEPESQSIRAFMLNDTVGEIGEALGIAIRSPDTGGCRWGLTIGEANIVDLSIFPVQMGDVRLGFSPELAAASSGTELNSANVVLVGAGALGSQLAMTLCREGFGKWVIVDKDVLLPHNLARHALHAPMLGTTKSASSTWLMQQMHNDTGIARSIVCDVLSPGDKKQELDDAFSNADLIIDASASTAVARSLSHNSVRKCAVVSLFLNPEGCDLVALSEGNERCCRLDEVEMAYFTSIASLPNLSRHLKPPKGKVLHSTSCREPSVQIPQSRITRLVGRAADVLRQCQRESVSKVLIWHDADQSQSITLEYSLSEISTVDIDGWRFVSSKELLQSLRSNRNASPHIETGGVIAGIWDREHRTIYATNAIGPPTDSVQERNGFVRGVAGLQNMLAELSASTAGNVGYVGEWHTHPEGHTSHLSTDDIAFLENMRTKTTLENSPALMIIVGDDGIRIALLDDENDPAESFMLS